MATITFLAGVNQLNNFGGGGSGLGFYGSSFGSSIPVDSYNTTTFITNSAGTSQGQSCNNVTWTHANSGTVNAGSGVYLRNIPNVDSTLKIRFTHTSPVILSNAKLYIYDRVNVNNSASGVTTKVSQVIHPNVSQGVGAGSGGYPWSTFYSGVTGVYYPAVCSPGQNGLYTSGVNTSEAIHDFFWVLSASPNSIGAKDQFALSFSVEYI